MALKSIRFDNFAGVRQGFSAGGVPLNWAADAQNVSTAGGVVEAGSRDIRPSCPR